MTVYAYLGKFGSLLKFSTPSFHTDLTPYFTHLRIFFAPHSIPFRQLSTKEKVSSDPRTDAHTRARTGAHTHARAYTYTQIHAQCDRQTDRQTGTDRQEQTDRKTQTGRDRQTYRQGMEMII